MKKQSILPGFGLSLGYTITYLSFIVIIPLSMLVFSAAGIGLDKFLKITLSQRVLSSYFLSFYTAFLSAAFNAVIGLIAAWVLVRYNFFGKKIIDSLVDIPFALPTAVAGISLSTLFSANGWLGKYFEITGLKIVNTPIGITIALIFIGFPFVVRTVQPVLEDLEKEVEEAALSLGADKITIFFKVILPNLVPALLTGFTLSFARSLGEYGSVIFIAGNIPFKTEIAPLLIMVKLDQFDYAGASSIALTLLLMAFVMLLILNFVQRLNRKHED